MRKLLASLALGLAALIAGPATAGPLGGTAPATAKAVIGEPLVQQVHRRRFSFSYGYAPYAYGAYSYRPRYYPRAYAYYYPAPYPYGYGAYYAAPRYRIYKRKHRDWDEGDWDDD